MTGWLNHGVTTLEHIAARDEEWNANKELKQKNKGSGDEPPEPPKPGKYDGFYL